MSCEQSSEDTQGDFNTFIIANSFLTVIFLIGLYLQIKIIISSNVERGVTWRIDMCNSIVMIVFYSFRILFEIIIYIVPVLHIYTGKWFCYVALFLKLFGAFSVISHSIVVSVYKYIFIVHQDLIRYVGVDNASLTSFWISLILPAALAVSFIARPVLPSYASIFKCLEMKVEKSAHANESSTEKIKALLFCGFDDFSEIEYGVIDYLMNIINMFGCLLTTLVVVFIIANIMEAFFYQRIFRFIKT